MFQGEKEKRLLCRRDFLRNVAAGVAALIPVALLPESCGILPTRPNPFEREADLYRSVISSGGSVYLLGQSHILKKHAIPTVDSEVFYSWQSIAQDPSVAIYQGLDTLKLKLLATVSRITSNLAPSTDGKVVFATGEGNILELGPDDKKPELKYQLGDKFKSISVLAAPPTRSSMGEFAFVQDGKLYTIESDKETNLRQNDVMEAGIAYSPSGDQIAYTHWTGAPYWEIKVLSSETDLPIRTNLHFSTSPDWNSDGRLAVDSGGSPTQPPGIYIFSPGQGREKLSSNLDYPKQPHWSPDGQLLAFIANGGGRGERAGRYLYIADLQKQINRIVLESQGVSDYTWLPDSKRIAMVTHIDSNTGEGSYYQLLNIPG
ncbi:PD40 domain-containing protein [Candidatus Daviesbacteria bacterium]|nr:PD40 domain-containing protein [Candidatus Daviesbacteria bacterium]